MAEMAQGPGPEKEFGKLEALINSMTPKERRRPEIINGSRKRRIAAGAGLQVPDLNRLLKQHKQMQKMMKKAGKKGGMQKMMRGMPGMMGGGQGGPGGRAAWADPAACPGAERSRVCAKRFPSRGDFRRMSRLHWQVRVDSRASS